MRFFMLDRITAAKADEFARGIKNISMSEGVFRDHFPGYPIYPGSLLIEGLAQLSGFLLEYSVNRDPENPQRAILVQVDKAKFHTPARPGDQLQLEVKLGPRIDGAAGLQGIVRVDGERIASAKLTFFLQELDIPGVHQQRQELYAAWTRGLELEHPIF